MATKLGVEFKRGDTYNVDPNDVILHEENRGRKYHPSEQDIIDLATSILLKGQLQAAECRLDEEKRPVVTLGFTRTAAIRLIRTGFVDAEGNQQQDPEYRLKITIVNCNDEEAFERNIVENAKRSQTSWIDDACNHQKLRERYGYSNADIMRLYGWSNANRVTQCEKLLALPESLQEAVHNNNLPVSNALLILDLPADQREAAFKSALGENGKVNTEKVKTQVRDHHLRDDNKVIPNGNTDSKKHKGKHVPRSMRDVRKYLQQWIDGDSNEELKQFFKVFLNWTQGKRTDKSLDEAIDVVYSVMKIKKAA